MSAAGDLVPARTGALEFSAGQRRGARDDDASIWRDPVPDGWWMFGLSVPWLIHRRAARQGENLTRYFEDQALFLRSMTSHGHDDGPGPRLQLRYWSDGSGRRTLRCAVYGAAPTRGGAQDLLSHLLGALPRDLPLEVLDARDARSGLWLDTTDLEVAEIRRAIRRPELRFTEQDGAARARANKGTDDRARTDAPQLSLVIPWVWTATCLEQSLFALAQQPTPTLLAVVLAPSRLSDDERRMLRRHWQRLESESARTNDQLTEALHKSYRGYQREMDAGCLRMNVFLGARGGLGNLFPKLVASDLATGGGAVAGMAVPEWEIPLSAAAHSHLLDTLALRRDGGLPRNEKGTVAGFADKFPVWEANVAFRFPVLANDLVIADW